MVKHGKFYFKQTAHGNLLGEFFNEHSGENITTESCDIFGEKSNEKFIGEYQSTWFEKGEQTLKLKIEPSEKRLCFKLIWYKSDYNLPSYEGEDFIVDNYLVGIYWSL